MLGRLINQTKASCNELDIADLIMQFQSGKISEENNNRLFICLLLNSSKAMKKCKKEIIFLLGKKEGVSTSSKHFSIRDDVCSDVYVQLVKAVTTLNNKNFIEKSNEEIFKLINFFGFRGKPLEFYSDQILNPDYFIEMSSDYNLLDENRIKITEGAEKGKKSNAISKLLNEITTDVNFLPDLLSRIGGKHLSDIPLLIDGVELSDSTMTGWNTAKDLIERGTPLEDSEIKRLTNIKFFNLNLILDIYHKSIFDFLMVLIFRLATSYPPALRLMVSLLEKNVSRSGLHQRFTEKAATFVKRCLQLIILKQSMKEHPIPATLLNSFNRILIHDSSSWDVFPQLKKIYTGSGGNASEANCKLQFCYDYKTGSII